MYNVQRPLMILQHFIHRVSLCYKCFLISLLICLLKNEISVNKWRLRAEKGYQMF